MKLPHFCGMSVHKFLRNIDRKNEKIFPPDRMRRRTKVVFNVGHETGNGVMG